MSHILLSLGGILVTESIPRANGNPTKLGVCSSGTNPPNQSKTAAALSLSKAVTTILMAHRLLQTPVRCHDIDLSCWVNLQLLPPEVGPIREQSKGRRSTIRTTNSCQQHAAAAASPSADNHHHAPPGVTPCPGRGGREFQVLWLESRWRQSL